MKGTTNFALMGKVWGVLCEYLWENWHFITALHCNLHTDGKYNGSFFDIINQHNLHITDKNHGPSFHKSYIIKEYDLQQST